MAVTGEWLPLLLVLIPGGHAYCTGIGANPGFTGKPTIKQLNITAVLVSWGDVASRVDCADQFLVKSGQTSLPSQYSISDMVGNHVTSIFIYNLVPEIDYFFEVIAREDKGWRGVEYNRSPHAIFATSRKKENMKETEVKEEEKKVEMEEKLSRSSGGGDPEIENKIHVTRPAVKKHVAEKSEKAESMSIDTETLVWIIVGSLGVLLLAVGLVYNLVRRRRDKDLDSESSGSQADNDCSDNGDNSGDQESGDEDKKEGMDGEDDEEEEDDEKSALKSHKRSSSFYQAKAQTVD